MFHLSPEPLDSEYLRANLVDAHAGALVVFEGWVRDHNQGKSVSSLEYQVYPELAIKEGNKILSEARSKFNLVNVCASHRFGHLKIGETAVWIAATAAHRDDAFKATRFIIDEIKYRLPIWKKEHYVAAKAEWVFCKHHHTHVHFDENDFYQKQNKLISQPRLKNARVLVIGAGGLGCPALSALAAAGVGKIGIVDFDRVEISNVHRQILFSPELVGEKKALVAAKKLASLNPFIEIQALDLHVNADNIAGLLKDHDLILDCTDNMRTKLLIHDACFKLRLPLISASIFKNEGQVRTFVPGSNSGCLRCLVSKTPDDTLLGNCNDFGVLASGVGVIGNIQASEALSFLNSGTNATIHHTLYFNVTELSQMKIKNSARPFCECCAGNAPLESVNFEIGASELTPEFKVVDIRSMDASAVDSYLHKRIDGEEKIAVMCDRGVRSFRVVKKLRDEGRNQFYSVKGGACSL